MIYYLYVTQIIFYPQLINSTYQRNSEQFNSSKGDLQAWKDFQIDYVSDRPSHDWIPWSPCHLWGCASHQIPLSNFKMLSVLHNHPWLLQQFRMWFWTLHFTLFFWKCKCKAVVHNWWVTTWKKGEQQGENLLNVKRLLACSHPQICEKKYFKIIYKIFRLA